MAKTRVYDETSGVYFMMEEEKVLPCNSVAELDMGGGYPAYRCTVCNALQGSIAVPQRCINKAKLLGIEE